MAIQAVSTRLEGHQILGARVLQRCAAREAIPALREVLLRESKVHGGGFQLRSARAGRAASLCVCQGRPLDFG
jgi:uncharacterized protein (UPF0303 family)